MMVLAVASVGYSQVKGVSKNAPQKTATMQRFTGRENLNMVQSQPNMLRSDGELDYTYYDWQSNDGARTWTHVWPDGKVNFAFTCASTATFADRGTAIGTYDAVNDEWIPCGGRVENEKTGFGTIAQYGENGLVVAAHTADKCGVWIIPDKDNITPNSYEKASYLNTPYDACWPNVMTSGPNRNIIHLMATANGATNVVGAEGATDPLLYFRSQDGGQTWDKENVILPYLNTEYGIDWTSNCCYWMETTEDNCLALVINNAWSDGMVLYSYDDGETWERKVFFSHPGPEDDFTDIMYFYPRWTSAQWDSQMNLHLVYEFNGTTGVPGSGSYYPGLGGVAYWNENMGYRGDGSVATSIPGNLTPGEPFVMDTAYLYQDIYASWWLWSDATHEMWNEYIGYLPALDSEGNPEEDPYNVTEFNIEDRSLHGSYNSGCCAMPVMCKVPGVDEFIAVWSAMDENNVDGNENYYYKLFASYSADGGNTWQPQIQLTTDFIYSYTEFVYTQAAVVGDQLIIAVQTDSETGTYVQDDDSDGSDNFYQGLTFNINDLFAGANVPETVSHNTKLNVYPNPVNGQMNVILNQNAEIVVYNLMGQVVATMEGHVGGNVIDASNLNSGVYFVSAGSDTQKIIVK